jgi:DNA polymerase-3 subunit epsilon
LPPSQAKDELDQTAFVFLDIETTGIGLSDQIVEIAIVDDNGETLVSTRVRPTCRVNPKALAAHGLSNDVPKNEPLFYEIEEQVIAAVQDKYVVMYSRDFDLRFLGDRVKSAMKGSFCCMREFARFHGEQRWNGEY